MPLALPCLGDTRTPTLLGKRHGVRRAKCGGWEQQRGGTWARCKCTAWRREPHSSKQWRSLRPSLAACTPSHASSNA